MAGRIRRRGEQSWELSYDVGRDANGRRVRRTATVRGSFKDAESRLIELLSQRDQGFDVEPHRLTVEQFLAKWLETHSVEPQSRARYAQLIRRHIVGSVGSMRLTALKPLHVQSLLSEAETTVSASTARDVFTLLRMAFAQAVRWQLMSRNPADAVERPKVETTDAMRVLLPGEIEQLLSAAEGSDLAPLIAFTLDTGVRRGEVLALRWSAVDLEAGMVEILRNARFERGVGVVYGTPKTRKSRRTIALSGDTLARLRAHRCKQSERKLRWGPAWMNDLDLVFTDEVGAGIPLGSFNRMFNEIVAKAGILGRVRFHDLRHTHGTLISQVASPKVVSDRLGHSDVKFTLNRYVNPTQDHQREAAEAFSALMKKAR